MLKQSTLRLPFHDHQYVLEDNCSKAQYSYKTLLLHQILSIHPHKKTLKQRKKLPGMLDCLFLPCHALEPNLLMMEVS